MQQRVQQREQRGGYGRWTVGVLALAALAAALAVDGGYVYDDAHAVLQSPMVQGRVGWLEGVTERDFWGLPLGGAAKVSWRPMLPAIWRVLWAAGDGAPLPLRAFGIVLHVLACYAALRWVRQLLPAGLAAATVALFALHPTHGEAVGGLVGHADIAASAAVFAALATLHARPDGRGAVAAVAWVGLGALCKESALLGLALLPIAAFGLGVGAAVWRALALASLPVGAAVLAMVARAHGGADEGALDNVVGQLHGADRAATALAIAGKQTLQLLLPVGVAPDHSYAVYTRDTGPLLPWTVAGALALALAAFAGWRALAARKLALALPIALAAGPIVAGCNLLFVGPTEHAERALYPATLGACVLVVSGWQRWRGGASDATRVGRVVLALALGLAAAGSVRTTTPWRSQRALFEAAVDVEPRSWRIRHNLGDALAKAGEVEAGLWHVLLATHLKRLAPEPVDWRVVRALELAEPRERLLLAPAALAGKDACGLVDAFVRAAYADSPDRTAASRTRAIFASRYTCPGVDPSAAPR
ncbi:MAG: transrane and repeat-containing protein 3 [Pseudomonadota bacterium]